MVVLLYQVGGQSLIKRLPQCTPVIYGEAYSSLPKPTQAIVFCCGCRFRICEMETLDSKNF